MYNFGKKRHQFHVIISYVSKIQEKNMTDDEKWMAVMENNASYDGLFFYAVSSTGIYCRPSCKSKTPKRENILFFGTAGGAATAGFRPCNRCRSDLLDYQPVKEIAEKARRLLAETDDEIIDIVYSTGFGSLSAFYRFFKSNAGQPPSGYRKQHKTGRRL
jgi:AraC family transcriptional regulator of adaptative response / methylphosphotriester-DNA alkyltransferase methyltransferase